MFPFKENLASRQKNFSKWVNTCEYIILHHTATGRNTIEGNKRVLLWETARKVSCHFIVDEHGNAYKLGDPKQILWHAWESFWKWKRYLNNYSVGIEIIWPLPWFTDEQRRTVYFLVQHLMSVLKIPKENVLRHKDVSQGRKNDVEDSFWNNKYKTYKDWQNTLKPREWV